MGAEGLELGSSASRGRSGEKPQVRRSLEVLVLGCATMLGTHEGAATPWIVEASADLPAGMRLCIDDLRADALDDLVGRHALHIHAGHRAVVRPVGLTVSQPFATDVHQEVA